MSSDTRIRIYGRLSYANLWEPKSAYGNKPKYSVSIIIPKSDKATINKVLKTVELAKQKGVTKLFGGEIPNRFHLPLKDGDIERPNDPSYKDSYYINASSYNPPKIVDRARELIVDRSEVYSGCYANVAITLYPYSKNGNKGVSAELGNVQKVEDGEPLGGIFRPEDDFEILDDDDDFLD